MEQSSRRSSRGITEQNEMHLINKRSLLCYLIMSSLLTVSYLIEVIKGNRSILYFAILSVLLWGTLVACFLIYRDNKKSKLLKEIMLVGFGIYYVVILFTAFNQILFVYTIPMLIVTTMYKDPKFCLRAGLGSCVVNIANIVYQIVSKKSGAENFTYFFIELACIAMMTVFMIVTAKTINEIFLAKLDVIKNEKERQGVVMNHILTTTTKVGEQVNEISKEAQQINEQSVQEQSAVDQIAGGTSEVANNIQNQLMMSNNINQLTKETSMIVNDILHQFNHTKANTETGTQNMEELMKASKTSQTSCETVNDSINELSKKINEVEDILGLIEGVTKQTSMLSLNASIEAARAGESGRGFAVVAANIQQLSEETKNATEEIKAIFHKLDASSQVAVAAMEDLAQASNEQTRLITKSKESFETIADDIENITSKVNEQSTHMNKVSDSNSEISSSIENVSAFTEELTASAEDTKNLTEKNLKAIERVNKHITNVVEELKTLEELA